MLYEWRTSDGLNVKLVEPEPYNYVPGDNVWVEAYCAWVVEVNGIEHTTVAVKVEWVCDLGFPENLQTRFEEFRRTGEIKITVPLEKIQSIAPRNSREGTHSHKVF